jgi:hypothetical protein
MNQAPNGVWIEQDQPRLGPMAGQVWRHFKGGLYQVVVIAQHTETGEDLVCYAALPVVDGHYWARPLSMWMDMVKYEGEMVPRFTQGTFSRSQERRVKAQAEERGT